MKPNGLLNVVSIILIVLSAIGIVLGVLVSLLGGAVLGAAAESVGVGLAVGGAMGVVLLAGSAYNLAAGILGVKGKFTACKVLGIISLVWGVIQVGMTLFSKSSGSVIAPLVEMVLPILYVIGAFKGPAE